MPDELKLASAYSKLPAIPALLRTLGEVSGMGCIVLTHIQDDRWVACASYDNINFGLKPGDEVGLDTMICKEVGRSLRHVVIDNVQHDPEFKNHPAPHLYDFASSLSTPILRFGNFFGTICAYDRQPSTNK